MNPHRFIFVHHFLQLFHHRLEHTLADQLLRMKELASVFQVLEKDDAAAVSIEDEVKGNQWMSGEVPPSLALVLRKLQQFLHIGPEQIAIQREWNERQVEKLSKGESLEKVFADEETQTDKLKELDLQYKVGLFTYLAVAQKHVEACFAGV